MFTQKIEMFSVTLTQDDVNQLHAHFVDDDYENDTASNFILFLRENRDE